MKTTSYVSSFEKSQLFRNELKYLEYAVNVKSLHVDPGKVAAVLNFPVPSNKKIGKEICNYSAIAL